MRIEASSTFHTASYFRFSALQSKQRTLPVHVASDHSSSVRTGRSGKTKWQGNTSPIYPRKQASRDGHPKSEKIHGEIRHSNRKYQGQHSVVSMFGCARQIQLRGKEELLVTKSLSRRLS